MSKLEHLEVLDSGGIHGSSCLGTAMLLRCTPAFKNLRYLRGPAGALSQTAACFVGGRLSAHRGPSLRWPGIPFRNRLYLEVLRNAPHLEKLYTVEPVGGDFFRYRPPVDSDDSDSDDGDSYQHLLEEPPVEEIVAALKAHRHLRILSLDCT